jgi:hypothetical protein
MRVNTILYFIGSGNRSPDCNFVSRSESLRVVLREAQSDTGKLTALFYCYGVGRVNVRPFGTAIILSVPFIV